MAEMKEAVSTRGERKARKKVHHIEIHHGENGGHMLMHVMHNTGGEYQQPKPYFFGAGEGHKLMAHLAKHMKVKMGEQDMKEGPEGGE